MRLVVVLLVLVPALAVAQPGMTPPLEPMPVAPEPTPVAPVKDGGTATMLSIGATAGGFLLLAESKGSSAMGVVGLGGLLIGPAFGHIYAGEGSHAVVTSLVRAVALGTFIYGIVLAENAQGDCDFDAPCSESRDERRGITRMWIGGTAFVAATLYDWLDAHRAAHRANERHRLSVMPTAMPGGGPGFVLGGRF